MKISKKSTYPSSVNIKSAADIGANSNKIFKYDEAVKHIKSAMESLHELAKTDEIAKDAIVDLSVVLFDLRHE